MAEELLAPKNLTRQRHSIRLPKYNLKALPLNSSSRGAKTTRVINEHTLVPRGCKQAMDICRLVKLKSTFAETSRKPLINSVYWPVLDVLLVECTNKDRMDVHDVKYTTTELAKEFTVLERSTLVVTVIPPTAKRREQIYQLVTLYITSQEDPLLSEIMKDVRATHRSVKKYTPTKSKDWASNQHKKVRAQGAARTDGRKTSFVPLCKKEGKASRGQCNLYGYRGQNFNDGIMSAFMPNIQSCREHNDCHRFMFQNISKFTPLEVTKQKAAQYDRQLQYEKHAMPQLFANRRVLMKGMPCGAYPGVSVQRMPVTGTGMSTNFACNTHSDSCAKEALEAIFYDNDVSKKSNVFLNAFAVVKCKVLLRLSRHRFACVFQRGDVEHGTPLLDREHRTTETRHLEAGKRESIGTVSITKNWVRHLSGNKRRVAELRANIVPRSAKLASNKR